MPIEEPSRAYHSKIDLSGSVAPLPMPLPPMPASVWAQADTLRSRFHSQARHFFECEAVLAVTGIESGISALARLFQTWYGSMRVVLAEPSFDQWDKRFRRASHVVLDWPVELILEGDIPECEVLILGRPVNPTGQMIELEQIKQLAAKLRSQGGWLILDEAYLDWTGEESYASFIEESPAIVLRSLAPFSGLAGANIAFVCAPKTVCTALLNEVGTQAVSAPQWWLALEYFKAELWRATQRCELELLRQRLLSLWRDRLGPDIPIHDTGYCLAVVDDRAADWASILEQHGVLVRLYEHEPPILRCAIPRTESEWRILQTALEAVA